MYHRIIIYFGGYKPILLSIHISVELLVLLHHLTTASETAAAEDATVNMRIMTIIVKEELTWIKDVYI